MSKVDQSSLFETDNILTVCNINKDNFSGIIYKSVTFKGCKNRPFSW